MTFLHIDYLETGEIAAGLRAWGDAVGSETGPVSRRWFVPAFATMRSGTVAASTAIEGNVLSSDQVDDVLSGQSVDAPGLAVREILNYNAAMDLVTQIALNRTTFEWSEELLRRINAAITAGLDPDTRGEYRTEPVIVSSFYRPPEAPILPSLMRALIEWLRESHDHALVRVALLHLNLVAIHPWVDGNGRTARVAAALELMRSGIGSPEMISVEAYLREHRDEYVDALRTATGPTYDPDNHPATPWIEWYARVSVERVRGQNRVREALPHDLSDLIDHLGEVHEPVEWAQLLLSARLFPLRTSAAANLLDRSEPTARATLRRMVDLGWLEAEGTTRDRRYVPGPRLLAIPLRSPDVVRALRTGRSETPAAAEPQPGRLNPFA